MRPAVLAALLLVGCAHDPLDTTEIDAAAVDARNRVNELARELGELATPIMMFCGLVGDDDAKCEALRGAYDSGRAAVVTAQRYIDAFAKTGQGLAIVEAGITVIEAAVQEVRAETERLIAEVRDELAGTNSGPSGRSGNVAGEQPEGEAAPGAAEGGGSAEAAEPSGVGEGAAGAGAREVGPDASEAGQR